MRYRAGKDPKESRNDSDYTYYSYKFIGVKPTSYDAFEVNGAGRSNLLRSLTLTCDMCIVDLTGDVAGSSAGSTNLGQRNKFIFQSSSSPSSPDSSDSEDGEGDDEDYDSEFEEEEARYEEAMEDAEQNDEDME